MSVLEHLDELRSRLVKAIACYAVAFLACWAFSGKLVEFLLVPVRQYMFEGGDIVFIQLTEPFMVHMNAAALAAVFVSAPFVLYQAWAFVAPGLYKRERRLVLPFLVSASAFFIAGGAFGYYVATPRAAQWLLALGSGYRAAITLRSAFSFESRTILAMGLVFELPIIIYFLSRLGLVTPAGLLRQFRIAVIVSAVVAAVITPTGDMLTMSLFLVPMVLLYLIGVAVAWIFGPREPERT